VVSAGVVESVDVGLTSVEVASEKVEIVVVESVEVAVSVEVELSSAEPETAETIPSAPEAIIPPQSSAPNARTMPVRLIQFRPFMSPAPLLPRESRRME